MAAWQPNWSSQGSGSGSASGWGNASAWGQGSSSAGWESGGGHGAASNSSGWHIPTPPFFFRIYNPDGQGIMYKATHQTSGESYMCPGSRQVGTTTEGYKIWYIGGYSDEMPTSSMYQIIDSSISPLGTRAKNKFIRDNGLDDSYKPLSLYFDNTSYWFTEATSPPRTSKAKTKGKGKGKGNNSHSPRNKTSRSRSRGSASVW
jgi:hypothetical protein